MTRGLTYTLVDDADGAFEIAGDRLVTTRAFDYETTKSVTVTVAVSDGVDTAAKSFVIDIVDVNEYAPVITSGGGGASAVLKLAENMMNTAVSSALKGTKL